MEKSEKATLIALDGAFLAVSAGAAVFDRLPEMSPGLFLAALGLAAFRAGRAVSYNLIFEWLRDILGVEEVEDTSGAGMSTQATGHGVRHMLGELICCPICSGTWLALVLLALYAIAPSFGWVLLYALAAAGIVEVVHWVSEWAEWAGRAAREVSGSYWLEKNGDSYSWGEQIQERLAQWEGYIQERQKQHEDKNPRKNGR